MSNLRKGVCPEVCQSFLAWKLFNIPVDSKARSRTDLIRLWGDTIVFGQAVMFTSIGKGDPYISPKSAINRYLYVL